MAPLFKYVRLQFGCLTPLGNVVLFCLLLATICNPSLAQNVKGEVVVYNGTGQSPSQMTIDATQFTSTDMCTSIAQACGKLGTTNYPLGATIDARGFTGNQVCAAAHITTMLFQCAPQGSSNGATGGKLLLGEVNLYADGPTVHPYYEDGLGSGIGTPALIIPSDFWGIEGTSRGATPGSGGSPGTGTFLSICTGSGAPVTGCTTAFPKRSFPISSTAVSTTSGITTMAVTVSGTLVNGGRGTNIYPAELVMVKGGSGAGDNGTFKIQTINRALANTVEVTVPAGTAGCTGASCGTLFLGTPILGFASTSNSYNSATCQTVLCDGFGEHIKNLGFNCQAYDGCIAWQNLYAEEQSGADTFNINNYNFVGVDIHGGIQKTSQNFGPVLNGEIYSGTGNTHCDFGTTGIYLGDAVMRGLNTWTINNSGESGSTPTCANLPIAAVLF